MGHAGFGGIPKAISSDVLDNLQGVDRPAGSHTYSDDTKGLECISFIKVGHL